MPTLDDLNEIKTNLLSLGDEPGILAAKGETPVDIGPPETGLSDDINALFDDFADVEEPDFKSDTSSDDPQETEASDGLFEDFDLDLDDEPVFDMDGFDAPEPNPSAPEPVEGSVPEQFDELPVPPAEEDIPFEESEPEAPDSAVPEQLDELNMPLDEGGDPLSDDLADDLDMDFSDTESEVEDPDFQSDDLGFEDLVGLNDTDNLQEEIDSDFTDSESSEPESLDFEDEEDLSFDDSISDENDLGEELDLSTEEDIDFGEEAGLSFDDSDMDDSSSSDDFDISEDTDFSFDDTEPDEVDLSGSDSDLSFDDSDMDSSVPELAEGDDFEMPDDEIDLGVDEELSLDDSDSDGMDLDEFELSDDGFDENLEIDEFDLGDLGQDFGVLEEDLSSVSEKEISLDDSSGDEEDLEEEEFEIQEKSFERVKVTLQNLPRNLKLIIEEEIGEKGLKGPSLQKLIDALAEGKSPKEIASITSKIVGKKIKIPANYSKQTGSEFEEEKDSFQYAFFHRIIPLLKIFLISSIIITGISYVSYKFIYRPVHAYILYNRGYEQLEESNYNRSVDLFDQAVDKYKMKKQFYRYADGYIESNQWEFARTQYDKLLLNYPYDKKGTMDYATMEFEKLADYEHSSEILNNFLEEDKYKRDYEALYLLGDIYLEWGWENYDKYEEARLSYAKIMNTYGIDNKILFRMLRYFIRTDNDKEVEILKKRFQLDKEQEIDPYAFTELAGYQIDRQDIDDVQELLFRAKDVDNSIPEIHYQLARLFNITEEGGEEDKALNKTLLYLENIQTLNRRNREIKIDTYRRQGERFFTKEEYLQAEEAYDKGIDLLKESRERNIIKGKSRVYGELFADLGHIYYYISVNPDNALSLYETAEGEGFYSSEIHYNKGNIRYRSGNFRQALLDFYNSAGSFSVNSNLLHATANTLYERNDYFAAQGYYNHLLDILEMKISREFSIRIDEREDHRLLVESLMKAYNNMGVTLYGLFERTGDPSKFSAAMLSFTQSNEYFDSLTRDPETLNRTDMINLAALNQRKMLYPIPNYELQIFADIPKRLDLR